MRIIGITGGSGSGKSTLLGAIAALLGTNAVSILRQDDYYRDLSHLPLAERAATNFDHPNSLDLDLLAAQAEKLRAGEAVDRPSYDFTTHTRRAAPVRIESRSLLLIEGTLIGAHPALVRSLDCVVFVDLEEPERLARRICRDIRERGRTEESVRRQWALTVAPMHAEFVEPVMAQADLVVRADEPPAGLAASVAAHLLH